MIYGRVKQVSRKSMKKEDNLNKILEYILGIKPDEFLLIPDENGFIKIKNLFCIFINLLFAHY